MRGRHQLGRLRVEQAELEPEHVGAQRLEPGQRGQHVHVLLGQRAGLDQLFLCGFVVALVRQLIAAR